MSFEREKTYKERYEEWLNSGYYKDAREELLAIKDDEKEIEDRFCKDLEFGTAGLRGIIGAGTNRMNIHTVGRAAYALGEILRHRSDPSVVIAYDSRNKSREFAERAAKVLTAKEIKVYLFDDLRPVPELSFAVRHLKTTAGIVITASHNPKEYNGFKVYEGKGNQILEDKVKDMVKELSYIRSEDWVKTISLEEAKEKGLLEIIGKEIDDEYIKIIKRESINPEIIERVKDFKVVYTPIHGTGNKLVRRVLDEVGFKNVLIVKEQELPDPEFSTVKVPNPEDINALSMGIELAKKEGADLVIGTDPDCDRVGVAVRNPDGEYVGLTGNQIGCLLLDYVTSQKMKKRRILSPAFMAKSIVTTKMANKIAKEFKIDVLETLTGFKYIGKEINKFCESLLVTYFSTGYCGERERSDNIVMAFEESYGYLIGSHASRDKDGVVSSMVIAEMAAYYKEKGMTLCDAMQELYKKYGYYLDEVKSYTLQGVEGREKIKNAMEKIRADRGNDVFIQKLPVKEKRDYLNLVYFWMNTNSHYYMAPPRENVLYYDLGNEDWFCIRPSGTEPKLKLYFGVNSDSYEKSKEKIEKIKSVVIEEIEKLLYDKE